MVTVMGYVVMDMEWNQAMSSQSAVFNKLPIHLRGEIIQIGAVKLTDDLMPGEEFQIDVRPIYFRRMHYKVEKLTGFDKDRLSSGEGFKEALAKFREWCGDGCTFLTWGSDDQGILEQNIIIHDLDWDWIDRWVNLQIIYNLQTNAGRNQTGLSTAMEHFEIEQTRVAHDALGDAYNTALVCSKLDLEAGLTQYEDASKKLPTHTSPENGEASNAPEAIEHCAFTGFATRADAFADKSLAMPVCPICGEHLKNTRWVNQGDKRYMSLCSCKKHGSFLVRIKFREAEDTTWTVNRIIYKADTSMEEFYKNKAHPPRRSRTHSKKKASPRGAQT
ncbi:MAG: 3'-5' exonuclease [Oscillospiraceae bacterium]